MQQLHEQHLNRLQPALAGSPAPEEAGGDVPTFPIVLRGYQREVVDRHLAQLRAELDAARQDADSAPAEPSEGFDSLGSRVAEILRVSNQEAAALVSDAQVEAREILARARLEAEQLQEASRAEVAGMLGEAREEYERLCTRATSVADQVAAEARDDAKEIVEAAQREAHEVNRQLEERVERIVSETDQRSEAAARRAEEADRAYEHAKQAVAAARHRGEQIVAAAEQRVEEIRAEAATHERRLVALQQTSQDAVRAAAALVDVARRVGTIMTIAPETAPQPEAHSAAARTEPPVAGRPGNVAWIDCASPEPADDQAD